MFTSLLLSLTVRGAVAQGMLAESGSLPPGLASSDPWLRESLAAPQVSAHPFIKWGVTEDKVQQQRGKYATQKQHPM